jgi:hypothetical protein
MRFGTLPVSVLVGVLLASLLGASACGSNKPPPASGDTASTDSGVESFAEVNPADLAELNVGKAGSVPTGATPAASAAPAPPKVEDECTPVGVDFEKRARPKLKDCYATGKKKDANLQGTVKLAVEIDGLGKVKTIKITEKTLPEAVAQCMLKVVKSTPLPESSKCPSKTLTIPMTFPTPR